MFQTDTLQGQTILITGGGTGLGRAMAERFAEIGAKVAIVGRRPEPLAETAASAPGKIAHRQADVRDRDGLETAIDELKAELGPVTGLVNNAAGNFLSASEELSARAFDAVVQIVLYGTFNATQALGRRWIERGSAAHVLSIATTYAWMGSPFVLPSACAKAGVLAMTRSLAIEWATYGIRSNAIAPGPFPTEGAFSRLMPDKVRERMEGSAPLGRFGEPAELADLAAFLFSPMAGFINGECIVIDGGEWLKVGQEFGALADIPRDQAKAMMASLKPPKRS